MSGDVGPSIFVSGRIVVFRGCSTSVENPSKERNDGMEHTIPLCPINAYVFRCAVLYICSVQYQMTRTFVVTSPPALEGREFQASIPVRAARKAFTSLCRMDSDRILAMIMIRESAPFRKERNYCYEIKREKLDNPISVDAGTPFEVSYRTTVRAVRKPEE